MDDSYFAAITAIADATAAKEDQLTAGTVQGGRQMFDPNTKVVRAIKVISPVNVAIDTNHVEVTLDQSGLASTSALLAVKSIAESNNQALADLMPQVEANNQALTAFVPQVAGKQAQLSAGDGMVFHEKLLEGAKIKSLTAGSNVTLESTSDFVTISAQTPPQVVAPFSVMGPNMMAVRARFGDTKAEIFAELEVNDDARVTGIMRAAQLRSDGIMQVGSSPPAGADLAVGGTVSATGNISTSAALRANSITPVSGTVVTATDDLTVQGTQSFRFRSKVIRLMTSCAAYAFFLWSAVLRL
jgi:hypothetical protein